MYIYICCNLRDTRLCAPLRGLKKFTKNNEDLLPLYTINNLAIRGRIVVVNSKERLPCFLYRILYYKNLYNRLLIFYRGLTKTINYQFYSSVKVVHMTIVITLVITFFCYRDERAFLCLHFFS